MCGGQSSSFFLGSAGSELQLAAMGMKQSSGVPFSLCSVQVVSKIDAIGHTLPRVAATLRFTVKLLLSAMTQAGNTVLDVATGPVRFVVLFLFVWVCYCWVV